MRRNKTWLWCVALVGAALLCASARGGDDKKGEEGKTLKVGDKVKLSGTLTVEREPEAEDKNKEKDRKILKATLSAEDGQTYHIILDKKGQRLAKEASDEDMAGCTVQIKGKVARRPLTPKERAELRKKKKHKHDNGEVWVKVMASRIVKPEADEDEEDHAEEDMEEDEGDAPEEDGDDM